MYTLDQSHTCKQTSGDKNQTTGTDTKIKVAEWSLVSKKAEFITGKPSRLFKTTL